MRPDSKKIFQWVSDVWSNKFLFFAILTGFITLFPILYIPVINTTVFKHTGLTWEWAIVFIESVLFFAGVETYKFGKRAIFRRQAAKEEGGSQDVEARMFGRYLTDSSLGSEKK